MNRMSYYPHNQPIVTALGTSSDNTDRTMTESIGPTATILPTQTMVERSMAGSPMPFDSYGDVGTIGRPSNGTLGRPSMSGVNSRPGTHVPPIPNARDVYAGT